MFSVYRIMELNVILSAWRSLGVCERLACSASRLVALWRFLALRYCVGHHFRAFGDHWVSGSLKEAMRAPLHVLVVLLCSAYGACSCSLLFQAVLVRFIALTVCGTVYHSLIHLPVTLFGVFPMGCGAGWRFFSDFVLSMSQSRSIFNSLSAGLFLTSSSSALS